MQFPGESADADRKPYGPNQRQICTTMYASQSNDFKTFSKRSVSDSEEKHLSFLEWPHIRCHQCDLSRGVLWLSGRSALNTVKNCDALRNLYRTNRDWTTYFSLTFPRGWIIAKDSLCNNCKKGTGCVSKFVHIDRMNGQCLMVQGEVNHCSRFLCCEL